MVETACKVTDQELVAGIQSTRGALQKQQLTELWKRYENQVHKHWAILRKQMNNSPMVLELHDDFYSEAYIALHKAVKAIKLDKIKDANWRFVGYFRWYLTNVRTELITKLRAQTSKETTFYVETSDGEIPRIELSPGIEFKQHASNPEEALMESENQRNVNMAVESCMRTWDDRRRTIFKLRQQGIAKGDVANKLGVHPATITYHLQVMQKDLEKALKASL